MGIRLGTKELNDAILQKQDTDTEFQAKLKGLTFNFLLVGTDAPGNQDYQYEIKLQNGRFVHLGFDAQPAPSKLREPDFDKNSFDAKGIMEHNTIFKLVNGNLELIDALTKVQIVGDFGKLMSQLPGFISFLGFVATLGIEP
jgi:hypothetical protein